MPALIETWRTERDETLDRMQAIVESEERTPEQERTLSDLRTRAEQLANQIADHTSFVEARAAAVAMDNRSAIAGVAPMEPFGQRGQRPLSLGEQWIASEQFRSYRGHGTSSVLEWDAEQTRAPILTTTPDWDRGLFQPQRVSVAEPSQSFPLFDVCNVESVSTGSVDWVRYGFDAGTGVGDESASGNAAAIVAEGGPKPESTLAAELVEAALETIAHWVQVSRQSLEDSTRMRSIVDNLLIRGVRYKEHAGLATAITSAGLPSFTDPDLLAAIRGAVGKVQNAGFDPNAVLLNPDDWATLDIAVMGGTLNGPVIRQSFWGLTPVPSPQQPAGSAVVGDFKAGVSHFRRSSVAVYVTDSHASTFISNIFTLLGEVRAKSAIVNPNAMCETAAV